MNGWVAMVKIPGSCMVWHTMWAGIPHDKLCPVTRDEALAFINERRRPGVHRVFRLLYVTDWETMI